VSNPDHARSQLSDAWSGFDTALAVLFVATAFAAFRRSPWVGVLAASLGTMLLVDAWFDVMLESHSDERRNAVFLALFAELPMAIVCFWIAYRTEHFLSEMVEEVEDLHLPPPGQSAAEGDLVGIFEVPPDGEAAGETGHADSAA